MEYVIVFIFGTIIGSFFNVCIYRLPLGKSIVLPRSYCPFCRHTITWKENIPLLSYMFLRGRCSHCAWPIPLRYFLVELVTALAGVVFLYFFSFSPQFFVYWLFACMLITIVGIDIEHQEIPDIISIPGICIGAILMTVFRLDGSAAHLESFINSFAGILAGGVSMFLLGIIGELIFRKQALGGGDVKLMAMIGAFLGWKLVILTFFLAPVMGAGVGIFMKIRYRQNVIAYGPYLAFGAIISLLYGNKILDYLFVF